MKNKWMFIFGIIVVFGIFMKAQGGSQFSFGTFPGPLTGCPAPLIGQDFVCDVTGVGYEISLNGATYAPLSGGGTIPPVTSVFTRKGDVTAQTGDYSFKSIGGSLLPNQLPSSSTCSVTLTTPSQITFTGTSQVQVGTVVFSNCK